MSQHIIVVGGGIIGMLTARELHSAGRKVTLIDRQQPGQESTWAGGGIISPLFPWRYLDSITALASWSQAHYAEICAALLRDTGIDPEYTESGMLMVAPDEQEQALAWAAQQQRNLQLIDPATFRELEPQAAHPPARGLWMPEVAQVRNPRIAQAMLADLHRRGVEVISDTPVTGLDCAGQQCRGVHTAAASHAADQVIVCAGSWSGQLLGELPAPPAIHPVRGQMLLFKTPPGTISRIVLEEQRYIIPRRDGHVLFGSTMEEVGFDKRTTPEVHDELLSIVTTRFPVLRDYPVIKHWAGLRPGAPAGVPYIAPHPDIQGLFVNAGQFRNGVVLGASSARLMADLVLERNPIVDPTPYTWTAARG
jgi:glycine oxidase